MSPATIWLLRKLIGAGTPREAVADGYGCICVLIAPAGAVLVAQMVLIVSEDGETASSRYVSPSSDSIAPFSTGC